MSVQLTLTAFLSRLVDLKSDMLKRMGDGEVLVLQGVWPAFYDDGVDVLNTKERYETSSS